MSRPRLSSASQRNGDDGGQQTSLNGTRGLAQIKRVSDDFQAKAERFEAREAALRTRFQTVTESDM